MYARWQVNVFYRGVDSMESLCWKFRHPWYWTRGCWLKCWALEKTDLHKVYKSETGGQYGDCLRVTVDKLFQKIEYNVLKPKSTFLNVIIFGTNCYPNIYGFWVSCHELCLLHWVDKPLIRMSCLEKLWIPALLLFGQWSFPFLAIAYFDLYRVWD